MQEQRFDNKEMAQQRLGATARGVVSSGIIPTPTLKTTSSYAPILTRAVRSNRCYSSWYGVEKAPADPIIGLTQAFKDDPAETKVLLGVGAFRDDKGKPYVLPSVKQAEEAVVATLSDHEYAPISGIPAFVKSSLEFAYGENCPALLENRIAAVQTLSGTGACRIAAAMIERLPRLGGDQQTKPIMYLPTPTWGNHANIVRDAGLEVRHYRYLDTTTNTSLDFQGLKQDLANHVEDGATILLHACAHNPTGVDPTKEQWTEISQILKHRNLNLFFDCAYQGFASGDAENDAWAIRKFIQDGHQLILAQSYAKNFGLYGERVGALSFVCANPEQKQALESQLKRLIRPMYSSPPVHGARVVAHVLKNPTLRAQWTEECAAMASRIADMRSALKQALNDSGSSRNWDHITKQIGMFAFTGLTKDQCIALRDQFHVYLTLDGRISVAGLTKDNVNYVANAIHAVTSA
uniref:Aspartate aminotransferase n=1 Tax=Aureoumbra lagunensis TaxID=44058 RepID=A0A6S8EMG6_9STRA|mmetsp:Transcript_15355/g.23076  ORF Transcript_15355/g.23076 Transcript_15355/m.23076 type:complete len:464 (+) Transcript_15355:56-1447(+)